jgi:hypothetical protein
MTRHFLSWPAFLALVLAVQAWAVTSESRRDPGAYLFGDSGYYAAATDSLLRDGDLDLLNQFHADARSLDEVLPELVGPHGGEFGLAAKGYLTIKQSPVLSVAALPFYALLGRPGFLVFNLVVLNLLLVGMVKLAGDTPVARVVVLLALVTTPLWKFAYNFSPDYFLCALLVGGMLAARANRPTVAGVLVGLAVSTKVYVAVLVLPLPFVVWAADRRWSALVRFALGGLIGIAPGLAFNAWLFGAPWVTGYERQLLVVDGRATLADHTSRFTVPFLEGLRNLLFHDRLGLGPTAPLWFLWPVAMLAFVRERTTWAWAAAGVIVLTLALFAPYDGWDGGEGDRAQLSHAPRGNRYVFPAVVFGFALIGAAGSIWREKFARCSDSTNPAARVAGDEASVGPSMKVT